tara:strand:- start:316 stop:594 length:279 start_codon:yes stop_codon:yes gene_type:complete
MAQGFVDELRLLLNDDPTTSQWLLPLEPLLNISYAQRFCVANNTCYYLVYDDAFNGGEKWMTADEFYLRSKVIVEKYVRRGYYEAPDIPTGG